MILKQSKDKTRAFLTAKITFVSRPFDFVLTPRHSISISLRNRTKHWAIPKSTVNISLSCLSYILLFSLYYYYYYCCVYYYVSYCCCCSCRVSFVLCRFCFLFCFLCVFCLCNCNMQPATCNCICIRISLCARGRARSSSLPRNFAQRCQCCIVMIAPGIGTISNKRCRCRR